MVGGEFLASLLHIVSLNISAHLWLALFSANIEAWIRFAG